MENGKQNDRYNQQTNVPSPPENMLIKLVYACAAAPPPRRTGATIKLADEITSFAVPCRGWLLVTLLSCTCTIDNECLVHVLPTQNCKTCCTKRARTATFAILEGVPRWHSIYPFTYIYPVVSESRRAFFAKLTVIFYATAAYDHRHPPARHKKHKRLRFRRNLVVDPFYPLL